jgi:sporulation protein YlmC with PRC-barrel domain
MSEERQGRRATVPPTSADRIELGLRLLDHQIVGASGSLLGNVDNLEVRELGGELLVTGILSGPAAHGPRQPGLLGDWIVAVWWRLRPEERPVPLAMPMAHVRRIASGVEVSAWAEDVLNGTNALEMWLRRFVVNRIPSAKGGEDRLAGEPTSPSRSAHEELELHPDAHLASILVGARVLAADGANLGQVLDVVAEPFESSGLEVGRLRVTELVVGRHSLGGELGYTADWKQGPWLVARLVRLWHRGDRAVPWEDVATIDWDQRAVTLR